MIPIFIARVIQVAVSVAMMRVMTTLLSPAEVGAVALALSVSVMFNLALINPVWMYMLRRVHEWQRVGSLFTKVLGVFTWYALGVSILVPAVLWGVKSLGLWVDGHGVAAIAAISIHFLSVSAATTFPLIINTLGQMSVAAYLNGGMALASLVGCVLVVKLWGATMSGWLLGLSFGYSITALAGGFYFYKAFTAKSHPILPGLSESDDLKRCFRFAFPLAISVLFYWMQLYGYRFIFAGKLGTFRLGIFFAGYGLGAAVVNTVETILIQYFQPIFYKRISVSSPAEMPAAWEEYSSKVIPPLLLCVAFTAGAAPFLAKVLLSDKFQTAAIFAVWGAAVEALRAIFAVFSLSSHAKNETRPLIYANGVAAFVALGLSMFLIPVFGEVGAGVSLLVSFFFAIAVLYLITGGREHMCIRGKLVYESVVAIGVMLVFSAFLQFMVSHDSSLVSAVVVVGVLSLVLVISIGILSRIGPGHRTLWGWGCQ